MSTGDPLVVFCLGPERWLQAQALEGLRRRFLTAGFEETDFVRLTGPSPEPERILEAARTAPFGSPRRLVLVDGLEEIDPEGMPWLAQYLKDPAPTTCLVLCAARFGGWKDWVPAALQRAGQGAVVRPPLAAAAGRVEFLWCLPLKERELQEWVAQRSRRLGKPIEPAAVPLLVQRVGSDLQGLALALESLSLLAGESGRITRADVERLFSPSLRETAFEILDAAAAGRTARALQGLHEALGTGRMAMDLFLGALGWYYRKGPPARLRLAEAAPGASAHRTRRWPPAKVRGALEELLRADVRIKQGHPSPELLAGELLLGLARSP